VQIAGVRSVSGNPRVFSISALHPDFPAIYWLHLRIVLMRPA
jgi:hypothetical protein